MSTAGVLNFFGTFEWFLLWETTSDHRGRKWGSNKTKGELKDKEVGSELEGSWFKSSDQLGNNPPQETSAGVSLSTGGSVWFVALVGKKYFLQIMMYLKGIKSFKTLLFNHWDKYETKLLISVGILGHRSSWRETEWRSLLNSSDRNTELVLNLHSEDLSEDPRFRWLPAALMLILEVSSDGRLVIRSQTDKHVNVQWHSESLGVFGTPVAQQIFHLICTAGPGFNQ